MTRPHATAKEPTLSQTSLPRPLSLYLICGLLTTPVCLPFFTILPSIRKNVSSSKPRQNVSFTANGIARSFSLPFVFFSLPETPSFHPTHHRFRPHKQHHKALLPLSPLACLPYPSIPLLLPPSSIPPFLYTLRITRGRTQPSKGNATVRCRCIRRSLCVLFSFLPNRRPSLCWGHD